MYGSGKGVPQNYSKAAELFTKSAKQGNVKSQQTLGLMYLKGDGVIQNSSKAIKWLTSAANQEDAKAQAILGLMYYQGRGVAKDIQKSKIYLKQSCLNKYKDACDLYTKLNQ